MNILSLENYQTWSWSCILTDMIAKGLLSDIYINRTVLHKNLELSGPFIDAHDLFLFQNVDALRLLDQVPSKKVVVRMGGIDIRGLADMTECTKYDEGLQKVGAIVSTNTKLHSLALRNNLNSYLIPNGIDLEAFSPREHLPNERFVVGFAGNVNDMRHMTYKGYAIIAGAVTSLYNEVDFTTALYKHKQIPHARMVPDFYHKIDCLVSASIDEGCSNVIMEALACGVPVICTQVGYHGERLAHKENCLFIKRTISSIADAISRLKEDVVLYSKLSAAGRAFAVQHHDIRNVVEAYRKVISKVLTLE